MNTHFNPVSGATFSGRNLEAVVAAVAEHGYKSNRWITYFQASELGLLDGAELKGKAVGMIRFAKEGKKTSPKWYNVFNLDLFTGVPAKLLKAKPSAKVAKKTTKKAAKAAPKKAAKAAPKKAAKAAPQVSSDTIAIPVQGVPGVFLIPDANGVYRQVTLES